MSRTLGGLSRTVPHRGAIVKVASGETGLRNAVEAFEGSFLVKVRAFVDVKVGGVWWFEDIPRREALHRKAAPFTPRRRLGLAAQPKVSPALRGP